MHVFATLLIIYIFQLYELTCCPCRHTFPCDGGLWWGLWPPRSLLSAPHEGGCKLEQAACTPSVRPRCRLQTLTPGRTCLGRIVSSQITESLRLLIVVDDQGGKIPFIPPEKPLQLENTIRGKPSRFRSLMACAVLKAESGNHTCPACWII